MMMAGNNNNNNPAADNSQQNPLSSSLPPLQSSSELPQSSSSLLAESLTRLFTSMFIHANIAHIAFNLFALAYLGGYAERAIGVARYVLVYLISGIVGSFISWYYSVLHLTQWRCSTNRCVRSYLWCIRYSSCTGNYRAYYWLVIQIVFAVIGSVSALPIAFSAHVGGFIAGVLMTKVLVKLEQTKRRRRYFLQS